MNAVPTQGEIPTREQVEAFQAELKPMRNGEIADKRYTGEWGQYDPTDPRKSSWKVRLANRELTARKERRESRRTWAAIWAAFVTGWVAIVVAAMAIPLEAGKSVYCLLNWFSLCVSEQTRALPPSPAPAVAPTQSR
jgi:hypothetical protein